MKTQTQTQKGAAERAAYHAIDAFQKLCDDGYGCGATDRGLSAARDILYEIGTIPVRTRAIKQPA